MATKKKNKEPKYNVGDIIRFDYQHNEGTISTYYAIITYRSKSLYYYNYLDTWDPEEDYIINIDGSNNISLHA